MHENVTMNSAIVRASNRRNLIKIPGRRRGSPSGPLRRLQRALVSWIVAVSIAPPAPRVCIRGAHVAVPVCGDRTQHLCTLGKCITTEPLFSSPNHLTPGWCYVNTAASVVSGWATCQMLLESSRCPEELGVLLLHLSEVSGTCL